MSKTKLLRFNLDKHSGKLEKAEAGLWCSYYNAQQVIQELETELKKKRSRAR